MDEATDEFLKETRNCAALQIPPGQEQLTAQEFVNYLGIDLQLEPELAWVAREMLAVRLPPRLRLATIRMLVRICMRCSASWWKRRGASSACSAKEVHVGRDCCPPRSGLRRGREDVDEALQRVAQ